MSSDELNFISFHNWTLLKTGKSRDIPEINFHAIKYSDKCVYVWIGDAASKMDNLACSMQTPLEREPLGIEIMQSQLVDNSTGIFANLSKDLAIKLSKRLGKQVLVSFNVNQNLLEQVQEVHVSSLLEESSEPDVNLLHLIEKSLFSEIKSKPECF